MIKNKRNNHVMFAGVRSVLFKLTAVIVLYAFSGNSYAQSCPATYVIESETSDRGALTNSQVDLLGICQRINFDSNIASQLNAVQQVAARQYSEIADLIGFQNSIQVGDIGSRLASVRPAMEQNARDVASGGILKHPDRGLLAKGRSDTSVKPSGGAAGDNNDSGLSGRWGAFLAFSRGTGDKETTQLSRGFDYKSRSATLGVDYIINSSLIAGVALGYGETESALFQDSGQLDLENSTISLYLSKFFGNGWFVDGVIGRGDVSTESRRNIDFKIGEEFISQVALADFDSDQTLFSLGIGKHHEGVLDIDFSARVNYIETDVERFAESTNQNQLGFGLAIEIDEQDISSLTSDLSIRFSRTLSMNWGVLIPSLSLRWQREFERGQEALLGRFLSDPNGFDFQSSNLGLEDSQPALLVCHKS